MGDRASRPAIGFRYEPPPLFRWPMGFLQRHPRLTRQVNRAAAPFENLTKVILFSCNMCGGVRANGHCEVIPEMVCVWVKAERRSRRLPWRRDLFRVQAPLDWRRKGSSAIVNMLADPFAEDGEP